MGRTAKTMRLDGVMKYLLFLSVAWATPETTDFDVYHPIRTLKYLIKTTLPGGGNFANKLQPGYIYVWNGVKPRCALQKTINSMIYNNKKFLKNLGKEKDPKPDITKLNNNPVYDTDGKVNLDDEMLSTSEMQNDVRDAIIKNLKLGHDLCNYFTEDDEQMAPVDKSARVHLQKRIDAKTLMGPEKHKKYLGAARMPSIKSEAPWLLDMKSNERTIHPVLAKAYNNRRYVNRDCDYLLDIMPSYVDCIDGHDTETVYNAKGKMKKGVKYTGDAPISKNFANDLHKMTRLKKEPVSVAWNKKIFREIHPSGRSQNNNSRYHSDYKLTDRQSYVYGKSGKFLSVLDTDLRKHGLDHRRHGSKTYNDYLRLYGIKTPLLSPMFMGKLLNWRMTEQHTSDQLLAVRDWAPRNIKLATGDLNPYWIGKPVNKHLYPVINFNGRPMFRANAWIGREGQMAALPSYFGRGNQIKGNPYTSMKGVMTEESERIKRKVTGGDKQRNRNFIPKLNGSPDWGERTSDGKKFVYTYSAGCWTKLAPENYGYDIPNSRFEKMKNEGKEDYANRKDEVKTFKETHPSWKEFKNEHKAREKGDKKHTKLPKYKINKAMERWWKGDYGKQYYFSLKDAITQKRCNGDEMLWYLFYSKPSKMDEFCTNTNFGNRIRKDFCKLNPPKNFNFIVTTKNNHEPQNRGKALSWRPEWHKEKFGDDFIFTGFASENNPNVWDTLANRDEKFALWKEEWCAMDGSQRTEQHEQFCPKETQTRIKTRKSSFNVHSLSFILLSLTLP